MVLICLKMKTVFDSVMTEVKFLLWKRIKTLLEHEFFMLYAIGTVISLLSLTLWPINVQIVN